MVLSYVCAEEENVVVSMGNVNDTVGSFGDVVAASFRVIQTSKTKNELVDGVEVHMGLKGRFTTTRQCVAVANAVAFAENVPINGKIFVLPEYTKEPHIVILKQK